MRRDPRRVYRVFRTALEPRCLAGFGAPGRDHLSQLALLDLRVASEGWCVSDDGASGRLGAARGAVPARESVSGRSELERGARTAAAGRRGEYASVRGC